MKRGRKGKCVCCLDTGEQYQSIKEAADAAGVCKSAMSKHLSGGIGKIGGKIYMEIPPDATEAQIEDLKRKKIQELKRKRTEDLNKILIF